MSYEAMPTDELFKRYQNARNILWLNDALVRKGALCPKVRDMYCHEFRPEAALMEVELLFRLQSDFEETMIANKIDFINLVKR
jgi:hypothetical protein